METNSTAAAFTLISKILLTAIISDHMHLSFKPVSAMIKESAYYAHALLSDSFFIVFLVQGVKEEIYSNLNKDISITEEVSS